MFRKNLRIFKNLIVSKLPNPSFNGICCKIKCEGAHCFIGYYDIDPVNEHNEILYHQIKNKISREIYPEAGYLRVHSLNDSVSNKLLESKITTRALNWQLGSRCTWIDHDNILYNDLDYNNMQVSKIFNIRSAKEVQVNELPFWQYSKNTDLAVSLNFKRLRTKRPGYGYRGYYKFGDNEVVVVFSIKSGEILHNFSLDEVLELVGLAELRKYDPYFNHISLAPCGEKFVTLIHYDDPLTNVRKIFPILIDLVNLQAKLLLDTGYFSHHIWTEDGQFLAYLEMNGKKTWAIWDPLESWKSLNLNEDRDGHPTLINKNNFIIDTYPNKLNLMYLNAYNADKGECFKSYGAWRNLPNYSGSKRCDLHPRYSKNANKVIVDVPSIKGREILLLEV